MIKRLKPELLKKGFDVYPNQWIAFLDTNGRGFAQPDLYFIDGSRIFLVEAKLTQSDHAKEQCQGLYKPLLEAIYNKPVISVQVFHNIRSVEQNSITSLEELLEKNEGYWLWHNLAT